LLPLLHQIHRDTPDARGKFTQDGGHQADAAVGQDLRHHEATMAFWSAMCMCIYIYISVCFCLFIYLYLYLYLFIYLYLYLYLSIYLFYIYMCVCTCMSVGGWVGGCVAVCMNE
jgi:hypothetical protein